ncbi:RcpC/CpaB family pilus assembly protein [Streptomyces sp. M19]
MRHRIGATPRRPPRDIGGFSGTSGLRRPATRRTGRPTGRGRRPGVGAGADRGRGAARLLRQGDRVDVLATSGGPDEGHGHGPAHVRVVARSARVSAVPTLRDGGSAPETDGGEELGTVAEDSVMSGPEADEAGALIVLAVPRETALALAGAAADARLAVTVC